MFLLLLSCVLPVFATCCSQSTKQKAVYGNPVYSTSLWTTNAEDVEGEVTWEDVTALRRWGRNGIYNAFMTYWTGAGTGLDYSGYFGVQAKGNQPDMLLFSVWDKNPGKSNWQAALPMHSNCKRNCNDCAVYGSGDAADGSTGTKCFINIPHVASGTPTTWRLRVRKVAAASSVTMYGRTWTGDEWEVTAVNMQTKESYVIGRQLLANALKGIKGMTVFHEHIGCTPCGSFEFSSTIRGPWFHKPASLRVSKVNSRANTAGNSCKRQKVTSSEPGSYTITTGVSSDQSDSAWVKTPLYTCSASDSRCAAPLTSSDATTSSTISSTTTKEPTTSSASSSTTTKEATTSSTISSTTTKEATTSSTIPSATTKEATTSSTVLSISTKEASSTSNAVIEVTSSISLEGTTSTHADLSTTETGSVGTSTMEASSTSNVAIEGTSSIAFEGTTTSSSHADHTTSGLALEASTTTMSHTSLSPTTRSAITTSSGGIMPITLIGSIRFASNGLSAELVASSARAALAVELAMSERGISVTVMELRRLDESLKRRLQDAWNIEFIVSVPAEQAAVKQARLSSIESDTSSFSTTLKSELVRLGASSAAAASITITSFAIIATTTSTSTIEDLGLVAHADRFSPWLLLILCLLFALK